MTLEGSLQDMALDDLFRVFRIGAKSGVLLLSGHLERGIVYVCDGRLIDALLMREADHEVLASGDEAVLQLLQWDDALFIFQYDPSVTERPRRIVHDSEWLVRESRRRGAPAPPAPAPPSQSITLDTTLELSMRPSTDEASANLDLEQWRMLSLVSLYQSPRAICEKTGMTPDQVLRRVTALAALGLVEIIGPPRLPPPPDDVPVEPIQTPAPPQAALTDHVIDGAVAGEHVVVPPAVHNVIDGAVAGEHVVVPPAVDAEAAPDLNHTRAEPPAPTVDPPDTTAQEMPTPRRGILHAIIRRIRGL